MGRLAKAQLDEIAKLRKEGYTQQEVAEKVGVHTRTVRKYDPLRGKPVGPTHEQVNGLDEACNELVTKGLIEEDHRGLRISALGKRVGVKLEELKEKAVLRFMAEADRAVTAKEIETYLDGMGDELLDQALDEVTRHRS